ncbi:PadR family transcriptional regulator [candidate division KSB1 bacterium]
MKILTGYDELLLLTILKLKEDAYGATIMKYLTDVTNKEWSIGAIYDPLYRLEKNGYIKSVLTSPTPERGGRSKRVYKVTKAGVEALQAHQNVREELSEGHSDIAPDILKSD